MFAKSKCFMALNRTNIYVQYRHIRKNNQLKSAPTFEGLSRKHTVHSETCEVDTVSRTDYCGPLQRDSKIKTLSNVQLVKRKTKLGDIIIEAEALLGCRFERSRSSPIGVGLSSSSDCQTNYFNLLPHWFQRESSLIASKIPTLLGSGHPVLRLKQNIDPDAEEHALTLLSNNIQWRALIILLVSKAFGPSNNDIFKENRMYLESVEARQRTLSEITEMMHFAFCLHRTIVEIHHSNQKDVAMEEKESSLHLGNKIVILFGDLLLSRTSKGLSSLKNATVTELMSDAISDFSESEILRRKQLEFFRPVLTSNADVFSHLAEIKDKPKKHVELPTYESWKNRVNLDIASLIGRACRSSILISQHNDGASELAFKIGRQIGLVIQAYNDLEVFIRDKTHQQTTFDLCSLPVIFHLNNDSVESIRQPVDISEVYHNVMTSHVAQLHTQKALEELKDEALSLISMLPRTGPAPNILENFISTLSLS